MKRKRNLKTKLFLLLRKMGMLCKAPEPYTKRLRVARTVLPDGNPNSLEAEIAVFLESKKLSFKGCQFNIDTQTCPCGKDLQQFLTSGCKTKLS
jgi:hypothetical protein